MQHRAAPKRNIYQNLFSGITCGRKRTIQREINSNVVIRLYDNYIVMTDMLAFAVTFVVTKLQ